MQRLFSHPAAQQFLKAQSPGGFIRYVSLEKAALV